jgi:hypothetical protein
MFSTHSFFHPKTVFSPIQSAFKTPNDKVRSLNDLLSPEAEQFLPQNRKIFPFTDIRNPYHRDISRYGEDRPTAQAAQR